MIPLLDRIMLATSSSLAASIVAKATAALVLTLLITRLRRRSRAAVRHALLAGAFGVLLALPAVSLIAPPIRVVVPAPARDRAGARSARAVPMTQPGVLAEDGVAVAAVPFWSRLSLSALLFTAWAAGAALFLLPAVLGLWQLRKLRRSGLSWPDGQSAVHSLAREAGIHRPIRVLLSDSMLSSALQGPVTCGIVHPAIVFPPDGETWKVDDLNRAIVHELEHVRRGDWAVHCVARVVCAIYWFHPLVWMARRRLELEAERSCDDAVLGRSEATAYADQLVEFAQRLSKAAKAPTAKSPVLAMASRADLARRVGAVLDTRQKRGRAGAWRIASVCAAAALLVLTMAPLTMVAAPQQQAPVPPAIPAPPPAVVTPPPQQSFGTAPLAGATFQATTSLVVTNVAVSYPNGTPIYGLHASDFQITEDGVPQTISLFEDLAGAAPDAAGSLSSYYVLGYYVRNQNLDGSFRRVAVSLGGIPTANTRFRSGYFANRPVPFALTGISGVPSGAAVPNSPVGNYRPPSLIYKIDPGYSEEARQAKYQGAGTLTVEIDTSGHVTSVRVTRPIGFGLDEKATEAVKQWRFRPATQDGKPVSVQVLVQVAFRLL